MRKSISWALLFGALSFFTLAGARAEEVPKVLAPPTEDAAKAAGSLQTAVLAGGCFWGVQGVFQRVRGVRKVLSGYSGGAKADAQYKKVSAGATQHAESVQIVFDPAEVSYGKLLHIFFSVVHDPTQLNEQGPDEGPQYRSNIFYTTDEQKKIAQAYIEQLKGAKVYRRDIVTRVDPLEAFYPAEAYHQDFLLRNPRHPYIVYNDLPKIDDLKRLFPAEVLDKPVRSR